MVVTFFVSRMFELPDSFCGTSRVDDSFPMKQPPYGMLHCSFDLFADL